MPIPDSVTDLIERFDRNVEAYRSGAYNEATLRQEFINPFFVALGWDMENRAGYAEAYKDVVHEDSLRTSVGTKAPDYCFRIGGARKFFVEAKKPAVNVKEDVDPAYQLRRYAWSAKLPLSILTDFEELAVYDCRVKPAKTDKPSAARTLYAPYTEYPKRWDEIADIFSRDAVLKGSFDKYAESTRLRKGTAEVDDAFLKEIESWRDVLARNLALRNPGLSQRDLNFAVQRTIDRIIFLRICEDRGIENYRRLMGLLNGTRVYQRLAEMFRDADDRYNSGLFHFRSEKGRNEGPDEISLALTVDDKPLKDIIKTLYYPDSPYEFSVLPADILGQVYEQFLGKVIRLTAGHHAKVEDKPEVKKAGGVYYTPTYIVDYIVKNTVGKLVEGKTPKQVEKLRILDPACGSGSFLIGAYQYLLDWHRHYYVSDTQKWARSRPPRLYQAQGAEWRLTTDERKRILLNNIYGVDIDTQAVEVTKLSLLLKILESHPQFAIAGERMLPDLGGNIKCGNSLIGPDFYYGRQMTLLDDEERLRINVFDWNTEFPEIMAAGGFDAVIGNPPYGIVFDELVKRHLEAHYSAFVRNNDTYAAFVQRAVGLLRPSGLFGFILPNTLLMGPYFDELKRSILLGGDVAEIVDFGTNQVFHRPNVFTALLFFEVAPKPDAQSTTRFARIADAQAFPQKMRFESLDRACLESLRWTPSTPLLVRLLSVGHPLDDLALVKDVGLNYWTKGRGKTRGGSIADRAMYQGECGDPLDEPYLKGRDIGRYALSFRNHWLRHDWHARLDPKADTLRYTPEILGQEKIVYRQTADRIVAALEPNGLLTDKTLHSVVLRKQCKAAVDLRYLLGLLNSRLIVALYHDLAREEGRAFAQVKTFRVKQLPIRPISFSDPADKARHDHMVALVEQMLSLHKQFQQTKLEHDKTAIQRQIDAADRQIDLLVYELYGLTEDEIKIVESST